MNLVTSYLCSAIEPRMYVKGYVCTLLISHSLG